MSGDLCQALDDDGFDVAIVGGVRREELSAVLKALDPVAKPVLLLCDETQSMRQVRGTQPRILALRQQEGWLDAAVLIVSEALRRSEAVNACGAPSRKMRCCSSMPRWAITCGRCCTT